MPRSPESLEVREYRHFSKKREKEQLRALREKGYLWEKIGEIMGRRHQCRNCYENMIMRYKKGPWADEEDKMLEDGMKDGLPTSELRKMLNRSAEAINHRWYTLNSELKKGPPSPEELHLLQQRVELALTTDRRVTWADVGREMHCNPKDLSRWYRTMLKDVIKGPWTDGETWTLIETVTRRRANDEPVTFHQIGRELGRYEHTVDKRWAYVVKAVHESKFSKEHDETIARCVERALSERLEPPYVEIAKALKKRTWAIRYRWEDALSKQRQ